MLFTLLLSKLPLLPLTFQTLALSPLKLLGDKDHHQTNGPKHNIARTLNSIIPTINITVLRLGIVIKKESATFWVADSFLIYSFLNINLLLAASIQIVSSFETFPERMSQESRLRISRCMTRFTGRAPYSAS